MDFSLSAEQRELTDAAAAFARRELNQDLAKRDDAGEFRGRLAGMRRVRPSSRRRVGGGDAELGRQLDRTRLPSRADRRRSFLGHVKTAMPANPLAPRGPQRQHPKMLPDGAREKLLAVANSARDGAGVGGRKPYGTPEAALGTLMLEVDFLRAIT